jgi:hypothetical protein
MERSHPNRTMSLASLPMARSFLGFQSGAMYRRRGQTCQNKMDAPLVRRAKLGFASQGQVLTPEALARHRVPRVAPASVTATAKRTQGVHGPQCASVKG